MKYRTRLVLIAGLLALVCGCATPTVESNTAVLHPDEEDRMGGTFLESSDIRTIASQMTGAILSMPEVATRSDVTRIALAPVRNNTRFLVDKDIFLTRLRIELNRVSQGRVRFFMQGNAQGVRREILGEQQEGAWVPIAEELAEYLVSRMPNGTVSEPARIAIGEIRNTNIQGMNAESFLATVRSQIAEQGEGKVVFVTAQVSDRVQQAMADGQPLTELGVDYVLCGEFLAQGIQEARGRETMEMTTTQRREVFGETYTRDDTEEETLTFEVRQNPNVTKRFNCHLVNAANDTVAAEKMIRLEKKITSGVGSADYILTGEMSALSKATQGAGRSDYVIVSFQMVEPSTNEVVWEDAYESKRASSVGTVYR